MSVQQTPLIHILYFINNPWFKGKDIAKLLEFENTQKAIIKNIPNKNRKNYEEFKGVSTRDSLKNMQPHSVFINESGLMFVMFYIFSSKL